MHPVNPVQLVAFLFVCLMASIWPRGAAAETAETAIEAARGMLARQEYRQARAAFQRALESGELNPSQLVETYRHLAECAAALRDPEAAREAFIFLLAIDPEFYVPSQESPLVREPYEQARVFWQTHQLPGLRFVPPAEPATPLVIQADLRRGDRPALVSSTVLHVRDPDGGYVEHEAPNGRVVLPAEDLEGADELELFFTVHDEWGNTVATVGSPQRPLRVPLQASNEPREPRSRRWYQQWWFWTIVGAAVVGLAVGLPVGLTSSDGEGGCAEVLGADCDFELHPEL